MNDPVDIDVRGLSKSFGPTPVLQGVSFTVPAGSTMALLGPSGCGKSTTLSVVAGIQDADSGSVSFGGRDMTRVPIHRRGVGVVFQNFALFPHLTVQRNIEFGPTVAKAGRRVAANRAERAMELTQLTPFKDRLPRQLSGGQQQRVAIARALASEPKVLLLDEPLSSLDASLREEMQFEIRDLQRTTGISMIFVTHDQQEAMAVGQQIGVLIGGIMRQVGTPTELYEHPNDPDVARLLGKLNLIPATVESRRDGELQLRGPSGERWTGRGPVESPGASTRIMVRPEALHFVDAQPERANVLAGVVERATFLGRETLVLFNAGFGVLELRCSAEIGRGLRPGDERSVEWSPSDAVAYPTLQSDAVGIQGDSTEPDASDAAEA